jgi:hypothetical protein
MPRFHFPIVDGTTLHDPVGTELKDDEAARKHAESIARHVSNIGHKKQRNVLAEREDGSEVHKAPVQKAST